MAREQLAQFRRQLPMPSVIRGDRQLAPQRRIDLEQFATRAGGVEKPVWAQMILARGLWPNKNNNASSSQWACRKRSRSTAKLTIFFTTSTAADCRKCGTRRCRGDSRACIPLDEIPDEGIIEPGPYVGALR